MLLAIITYQTSHDMNPPSGEKIENLTELNVPIAKRESADKNLHPNQSQYYSDIETDITPSIHHNAIDLDAEEISDTRHDTDHTVIRLPSEQFYSVEFRDTLISSFRNGTMTFLQKRDFDTALNHPLTPTEDKILLNKEFVRAFQQRKITPEQMFSQLQ